MVTTTTARLGAKAAKRAPKQPAKRAANRPAAAEPVTEPVTVAASDQPATASMLCLGKEPECTPQCLLAVGTETRQCGCPCNGLHHGKLAHVPVPDTRRKPPAERVDEPALFDIAHPETPEAQPETVSLQGVSA